jgi:hypothetical protein
MNSKSREEMIMIRARNVRFEEIKKYIINKIFQEWKISKYVNDTIQNEFFNFSYTIEDCYNQTGNRTFTNLNSGKKIHDYRFTDIRNWLKRILFDD